MSVETPKYFLDKNGVTILWQEIDKKFINTDEIQAIVKVIDENKADKQDIPSTLPANGGNADSLGGYVASDYVRVDNDPDEIVYVFNCGSATELID